MQVIKRTIKRGQKWPLVHCPFPSFFTSNVKGALGTTIRIKNRYPGESDEHESDHRYSPAKPDPPLLTPENHLFFLHLLYLHISKNEDQKGFSRISLSQVVSENKKQPKTGRLSFTSFPFILRFQGAGSHGELAERCVGRDTLGNCVFEMYHDERIPPIWD